MKNGGTSSFRARFWPVWRRFVRSIWLFPAALTLILLLFTAFGIHGSSIGVYNSYFGQVDPSGKPGDDGYLLKGQPRSIRSDEWLVNSQMTIAQGHDGFARINNNIGDGQDMSLLSDAPYKEWSIVFKPHNLAFFVLPFDNAFAFKWWTMGYLLALSCYFFVLCLLPGRRLPAALLATALFFTPFVQWLYLYGTIGALFYSLFAATIFMKIINATSRRAQLLWSLLLAYITTCFALILYPPFQIPVAIVTATFALGYLIEKKSSLTKKILLQKLGYVFGAVVVAGIIALLFLHTRPEAVQSVQNTLYPGKRSVSVSGDFDKTHFFSSHLASRFVMDDVASHYKGKHLVPSHQSESSNFILLIPFLALPAGMLLLNGYLKRKEIDWPLLLTTGLFMVFLVWLFVPSLSRILNFVTLGEVPTYRLLIGTGLLGIIHLVLLIRNLATLRKPIFTATQTAAYVALIYAFLIFLGYDAFIRSPGFMDIGSIWLLAVPIPIVIYLLLRRRFTWALVIFAAFSIYSCIGVNPLYHGTGILTDNKVAQAIQSLSHEPGRMVVADDLLLENLAQVNGARALSGVYAYPQTDLWKDIDPADDQFVYNRYAHAIFTLDRDPTVTKPTTLKLMQDDYFQINTEPCSDYLREHDVRFLLTTAPLDGAETCASAAYEINYPPRTFIIYRLNWPNQQ